MARSRERLRGPDHVIAVFGGVGSYDEAGYDKEDTETG